MAQCDHEGISGGRCGLAPDHEGAHEYPVQAQCTAELTMGSDRDTYRCCLRDGHPGLHEDNGGDRWDVTIKLCGAMTSPDPDTRYDCTRRSGHVGSHLDDAREHAWPRFGEAQTTADLPSWGRAQVLWCGVPLTWDQESEGTAVCALRVGHSGAHGLGPNSGDYVSGRATEDMITELFRRVSQLESTIEGINAPEWVAELSRELGTVEDKVNGVERRTGAALDETRQALNRLTAKHTGISAVLETISRDLAQLPTADHLNRALTELGTGLFERLPAPRPVPCGAPALSGYDVCEFPKGHEGRHGCGTSSWPQLCESRLGRNPKIRCVLRPGHDDAHASAVSKWARGHVAWTDDVAAETWTDGD